MSECRIFVSSPGDVAIERTLVASVVERLKTKFGHRSQIKLILWEQLPLDANDSFQPQLPDPTDVELFLLILWRRIGTVLPDNALPKGFSGPLTGTEYEFLAALKNQQNKGKPAILVYRKMDPTSLKQGNQVDVFFQKHFTDKDQRLLKAFHCFDHTSEFEYQLETHLNSWFESNLPKVSDNDLAQAEKWSSGNPFQGLKAFRFEQANVYRGRSAAIAESIERLKAKAAQEQPFLLIMGMSGSGKSSLLRAGIIPNLYFPQIVPNVSQFFRGIMRPADIEGDPFAGLISALCAASANHLLAGESRQQLVELCAADLDSFIQLIATQLAKNPPNSQLILAIDQLEELYTSASISNDTRRRFSILVQRLVEELGIWVIATMRSDCYHYLGDTPEFLALKKEGGQLDLQPPELYNIRQMITEPAELAGLHFEHQKDSRPPLNEIIATSAAKSPESLPLLEFTLSQLYDARTASGMLTYRCYDQLGGIEGAIASHAENVFSGLEKPVQQQFSSVFNQLANSSADGRYTRKWAMLDELCADEDAATLVHAFLDARLLVGERNPDEKEVVTLAHESLFRYWPRLLSWLEENQNLLQVRNQVSEQVERWVEAQKDPALLLNAGKPLEDGKALLKSPLTLDSNIKQLIQLSIKRANRNRFFKVAAVASLVLITVYATYASITASSNQKKAETSLAKSQDLIEFLIGDLHTQLAKLGRLDVMQSIGEKALGYYGELDQRQATDENIANRSKALYQIGSVYIELSQYELATNAFTQSQELLALLADKHPQNFDYLFEFSQANFWVGYAFWAAQKLDEAEIYFIKYLDVAKQLVSLEPDNLNAKMEISYAFSNLGTLASSRDMAERAAEYFLSSIANSEAILKIKPNQVDALVSSADAYSWLGNTYRDRFELNKAIGFYTSEQRIFANLVKEEFSYKNRFDLLLSTNRINGLKSQLGEIKSAREGFYASLQDIQYLVNHDPANSGWYNTHVYILTNIGKNELLLGNINKAGEMFQASYNLKPELPEKSELFWADESFERHYWYWRYLIAADKKQEADEIANQLMTIENPKAKKWQIRLASRSDQPIEVEKITNKSQIDGPDSLIAYLEYAVTQQNADDINTIMAFVPDSLWNNPEFKQLKTRIESMSINASTR